MPEWSWKMEDGSKAMTLRLYRCKLRSLHSNGTHTWFIYWIVCPIRRRISNMIPYFSCLAVLSALRVASLDIMSSHFICHWWRQQSSFTWRAFNLERAEVTILPPTEKSCSSEALVGGVGNGTTRYLWERMGGLRWNNLDIERSQFSAQ